MSWYMDSKQGRQERVKNMKKGILNLKKLEDDLNKAFSFGETPKVKRKFPEPKPHYTNRNNQDMIKIVKGSKKFVNKTINMIKNRKINKLEKQTIKVKEKGDKLRHEIKTRLAKEDFEEDNKRLEKELKELKKND